MSGDTRVPLRMVWDDRDAVAQFDAQGRHEGVNADAYELSAAAISRLAPSDGSVLDLGSGSGRMLAVLGALRPDLKITGIELSKPMLELGQRLLPPGDGTGARVQLIAGDMLEFERLAPERVDVLSTMWTLEHLTNQQTDQFLGRISHFRTRTGCALWIIDFARLQDPEVWPQALASFGLPEALLRDSIAAERAAFTVAELQTRLKAAGLEDLQTATDSGGLGVFQAHWAPARGHEPSRDAQAARPDRPSKSGRRLEASFSGLPQQQVPALPNQR